MLLDLIDRLLILRTPGVGPVTYEKMVQQFGSVTAAAENLHNNVALVDSVKREIDAGLALGIHFICDDSEYYPNNLKKIKNHPPVICVRGNLETLQKSMVAIVGTRHASITGMQFTLDLAEQFANHSVVVVSGMAIGTDTAAHKGALHANGNTQTIAVLGGGVDYIWPMENEYLYHEILERGAIISEMPIGFVPRTTNFVQRNRWIAGIAEKLILGEADLKSGSMTTARFALNYKREVWAIPSHPSDARAMGPNSLISNGAAKLCSGIGDFFDFGTEVVHKVGAQLKNSELENILLDVLGPIPVSESVLADVVKKSVSEIRRVLVVLELRGLVQKQNAGYVRL